MHPWNFLCAALAACLGTAATAAAAGLAAEPVLHPGGSAHGVLTAATSAVLAAQLRSGDGRRPFAIVDKQAARLSVFHPDGRLAGTSPVLLGRTRGDHATPGVGERTQAGTLRLEDQTTPAGRFETVPGINRQGEPVVWLDWGAALAIHRLRPDAARASRERRLASPHPEDRRASAGCVVVPVAFYLEVVQPLLGRQRAVVHVLPET